VATSDTVREGNAGAVASHRTADAGTLFVFEGPDGVGKTSIVTEVRSALSVTTARPVVQLAFPGRQPGTLGHHVYQLHHDSAQFGVNRMAPASLQLLHVAAHLDAIDTIIRPQIEQGAIVLLDRYWWSTWVYGVTGGADQRTLRAMIDLERVHWGNLSPAALFLVRRRTSLRPEEEDKGGFNQLRVEYDNLAAAEAATTRIIPIDNEGELSESTTAVLRAIRETLTDAVRL
jgi:dTMP kinase